LSTQVLAACRNGTLAINSGSRSVERDCVNARDHSMLSSGHAPNTHPAATAHYRYCISAGGPDRDCALRAGPTPYAGGG